MIVVRPPVTARASHSMFFDYDIDFVRVTKIVLRLRLRSRTSNLHPATCVRRYVCIRIQVARPGHTFPGDKCPGVNAA